LRRHTTAWPDDLFDQIEAWAEQRGLPISAAIVELARLQLNAPAAPSAAATGSDWRNPDCEDCDGTGWAEHVSGTVIRCPTCSTITERFGGDRRPYDSTWR
jgi:hypothetical protein